jgi:integrase
MKLDDASIKRLSAPAKGYRVIYDTALPAFGVRVTANGARSFILDYRVRGSGLRRRYTIGSASSWRTAAARAEARRLRTLIDQGHDPVGDLADQRAAPVMADLIDRFIAEHVPHLRSSTADSYRGLLDRNVRPHFGASSKVADIGFADIDSLHRKITARGSIYAANRTIAVVSKMFTLSVRWGYRPDNPAKGIRRNVESKRRRYLKGDELARLATAMAGHPYRQAVNIIRLLLLTGARRGEVFSMRWADIDLGSGTWNKTADATKQAREHSVPLSAPARQLLAEIHQAQSRKNMLGEFVFPGRNGTGHVVDVRDSWIAICKTARITGLRIHDLRHSFASELVSSGASLPLIGALLGHSNPTTTARYSHLYADRQRAAVERVGAVIMAAGQSESAEPPTLIRRR